MLVNSKLGLFFSHVKETNTLISLVHHKEVVGKFAMCLCPMLVSSRAMTFLTFNDEFLNKLL